MTTRPTRSTHHRIGRAVAVVVAGSVFGVASSVAVAAAERPSAQVAPQQRAAELAAIAEWAAAEGLYGLSPASLRAVDD